MGTLKKIREAFQARSIPEKAIIEFEVRSKRGRDELYPVDSTNR